MLRAFPMAHPASPGLGDGATALVVAAGTEGAQILELLGRTHGEHYRSITWTRDRSGVDDRPWWQGGGDFSLSTLRPAGAKELMRDTVGFGAQTVREVTDAANVPLAALSAIASVQPRGWVPGAIAACLGLREEVAPDTYRRWAHLGGAGCVANWIEARERGMLTPGSRFAVYAQGAGFTRGAAVLRMAGSS